MKGYNLSAESSCLRWKAGRAPGAAPPLAGEVLLPLFSAYLRLVLLFALQYSFSASVTSYTVSTARTLDGETLTDPFARRTGSLPPSATPFTSQAGPLVKQP